VRNSRRSDGKEHIFDPHKEYVKGKGKVIPSQARCDPEVDRGIAVLFHGCSTRRGKWSASRSGRILPRERPGTHFTGGWVGPRSGLDGRIISSPPGFHPGPSSP
jgi:hypothetical protein